MKIHSLETGNFMLDGGSIFGVVPKSLWNKVYPADDNNMCNFSMRCLLIDIGDRRILIDTGLGSKQSEKFFGYYYLNGDDTLEKSLAQHDLIKGDITDVIITHLHFDHCGGAVERTKDDELVAAFPNADYWVSGAQWQWAMEPNQREKASFLLENFEPLERTGRLHFVNKVGPFADGINLRFYNGHTEGLIVPFITYKDKTIVYTSDMLPTAAHIPASWICGFDTRPLISMEERAAFTREAVQNDYILFFEHDIRHECCTLKDTEKGVRMDKGFRLKEVL